MAEPPNEPSNGGGAEFVRRAVLHRVAVGAETHEITAKPCGFLRVKPLLTLSTLLFLIFLIFAGGAMAQAQELFTVIHMNQFRDATPAQRQAIKRIRQRPTTQSLDLVKVDVNALRGETLRLSIPNTPALTLSKRDEEVRSPNDFTWYGTFSGVPGQATLVVHDGNITGSIQDQEGKLYRIEPVGNGVHALIKVDQSRFPPDELPSFKKLERRGDIQVPPTTGDASKSNVLAVPVKVGINVLVAYTTAAKKAAGKIDSLIRLAVREANDSYIKSGINIELTMVRSFEVKYSETGKKQETILADFVANTTVKKQRRASGADLAAMIIDQGDGCGLADDIMANASTAFAVVYYDCATGYYSFAHELGHLMGARHDQNNDLSTTPYAYGHDYQFPPPPPPSQGYRTIMAYPCNPPVDCEPRIQYWSNPRVLYGGAKMGTVATNDNARVLNETATTVAAFRNALTPGTTKGKVTLYNLNSVVLGRSSCIQMSPVLPGTGWACVWDRNSLTS